MARCMLHMTHGVARMADGKVTMISNHHNMCKRCWEESGGINYNALCTLCGYMTCFHDFLPLKMMTGVAIDTTMGIGKDSMMIGGVCSFCFKYRKSQILSLLMQSNRKRNIDVFILLR